MRKLKISLCNVGNFTLHSTIFSPWPNILDFIAPKGNAKTHIDVMKDMLKSEQKTEEQVREKERRRRESLERRHKLRE